MLKRVLIGLLFVSFFISPIADSAAPSAPISAIKTAKKQLWNLKDADIRAVIQTVSLLTGKDFIIDPQVKGQVTFVSQNPMTVDEIYQAFLSMLQVLNYAAIPSGRVIKIVPAANAKSYGGMLASRMRPGQGDEIVVRVIPIYNVSASELLPVVRSMMQPWASATSYTPSNSLILVGSASNLSRLSSIVHRMDNKNSNMVSVIRLKYASAKNLVTMFQSLQSSSRAEGRVDNVALAADVSSNSILVSGNVDNIARTRRLIRQLDRPVSNGGDTMVVHLNYLDAKKLAPVLSHIAHGQTALEVKGKTVTSGVGGTSIQAEESNNSIIMHAPIAVLQSLRKVIRQLDVRPSQVLVEAIIVKVDQTLLNQLGIVWGTVDSNGLGETVDSTTGVPTANGALSTANTFALKVTHGVGFLPGSQLAVLIHALKGNTSSNILATPSIVVLNNKPAVISDGKNIGIINRQYSSTVSTPGSNEITPFNTIQRQDVTLSLKVTPQISPDNMIRLKINQENDSVDASSTGGQDNPVLDVSKITTNVLVHSGDILVLGGLINNTRVEGEQKIPILGDIPLLGNLFRYKSHKMEKQNLMVFIKPVILNDRLRARHQTIARYNYIRNQEIESATGRRLSRHDYSILPSYAELKKHHMVLLPPPVATTSLAK